jgi:hypothetical protein
MPKENDFLKEELEDRIDIDDSEFEAEEDEDTLKSPEFPMSFAGNAVPEDTETEDEESELKVDKIFDNKFGESDYDGKKVNFIVDQGFHSYEDVEDRFQYKQLFDKIHFLIQDSEFKSFNTMNTERKMQKLNKVQINQVYSYVVNNLDASIRKIEIFSVMSDYFDIYPNKFYSSLSNKYKNDLILELDASLNILKKKKIRKLF